jgi:hypothetical protein
MAVMCGMLMWGIEILGMIVPMAFTMSPASPLKARTMSLATPLAAE